MGYQTEEISRALSSDIPHPIVSAFDPTGHGTSLVSVITGSLNDTADFFGATPKSGLVIIKLKEAKKSVKDIFCTPDDVTCYIESDIMLGVRYLYTVSQALRRPIVICPALGSNQGGYDGNGALNSCLDYPSQLPQIGIFISAGNEGVAERRYFYTTITAPFQNDFELLAGDGDHELPFKIWFSYSGLSAEILTPNRETTRQAFPSLFDCRRFQFIPHDRVLRVNSMMFKQDMGGQLILVRFHSALSGTWTIRIRDLGNEAFTFRAQLPTEPILSGNAYFMWPDPNTTIIPPGNGYHSLTVIAYNQLDSRITQESGRGSTRNGYIKPDLAIPGYQIPCALLQSRHGDAPDSGAAAILAGGTIAIVLGWCVSRRNYTSITGNDINRLSARGVGHGPEVLFPNNTWGHGELNVNRVFEQFASLQHVYSTLVVALYV